MLHLRPLHQWEQTALKIVSVVSESKWYSASLSKTKILSCACCRMVGKHCLPALQVYLFLYYVVLTLTRQDTSVIVNLTFFSISLLSAPEISMPFTLAVSSVFLCGLIWTADWTFLLFASRTDFHSSSRLRCLARNWI